MSVRDSDTGLDWKIAVGLSLALCVAAIGGGLLADAVSRLLGIS